MTTPRESEGTGEALTVMEGRIVEVLRQVAPRYATYADIATGVLGVADATGAGMLVRTHVHNIRQKLGRDAIETRRNQGIAWGRTPWPVVVEGDRRGPNGGERQGEPIGMREWEGVTPSGRWLALMEMPMRQQPWSIWECMGLNWHLVRFETYRTRADEFIARYGEVAL